MRLVIQRVDEAFTTLNGVIENRISTGLLIFVAVEDKDTFKEVHKMALKVLKLRIFNDSSPKMNFSVQDIKGELLIISQFTLLADCLRGNRPSFSKSGDPIHAKKIYNEFVNYMYNKTKLIKSGQFGSNIKVHSVNSGPATFIIDM